MEKPWRMERLGEGGWGVVRLVDLACLDRLCQAPEHRRQLCRRLLSFQSDCGLKRTAELGIIMDLKDLTERYMSSDIDSLVTVEDVAGQDNVQDDELDELVKWGFQELEKELEAAGLGKKLMEQPSLRMFTYLALIARHLSQKAEEAGVGRADEGGVVEDAIQAALDVYKSMLQSAIKMGQQAGRSLDAGPSRYSPGERPWGVERLGKGGWRVWSVVSVGALQRRLRRVPKDRLDLCLRLLRFQVPFSSPPSSSPLPLLYLLLYFSSPPPSSPLHTFLSWINPSIEEEAKFGRMPEVDGAPDPATAVIVNTHDLRDIDLGLAATGIKDQLAAVRGSLSADEELRSWRYYMHRDILWDMETILNDTVKGNAGPSARLCLYTAAIGKELSDKARAVTTDASAQRSLVNGAIRAFDVILRNYDKDAGRIRAVAESLIGMTTGGLTFRMREDGRLECGDGSVTAEDCALDPADGLDKVGVSGLIPNLPGCAHHLLPSSPVSVEPSAKKTKSMRKRERQMAKVAAKAAAESASSLATAAAEPCQEESRAEEGQGPPLPGSRAESAEPSESPPPPAQAVSKSPSPEAESLPASYPELSAVADPSPPSSDSLEARRRFAQEELERLRGAERPERSLVGHNVHLRRLLSRLREQNAAWRR